MSSQSVERAPAVPADDQGTARSLLLEAAQQLFLERGFAATRVADIAALANLSKGTVYLYFATKRDLFGAVIEARVVERLAQAEKLASEYTGSATDLLASMLNNNLLEFWGSPASGILRLVIAESSQFPEIFESFYEQVTGRARQLLMRVIQMGIDQGEYRQVDVEYTARCILNAIDHELVLAHSLGPDARGSFEPHRYIETLLQLIVHGVSREVAP